jgi:hypothetical protein
MIAGMEAGNGKTSSKSCESSLTTNILPAM